MANFCTKCGRKLIDGQPCICTLQDAQKAQEAEQSKETTQDQTQYTNYEEIHYEGPAYEETQNDVKTQAMNFFTQALEMIKHPSTGFVNSVADENSKNGLILMGIEAILAGLYLYVLVQKIVATTLGGVSSALGMSSNMAQTPSLGQFFGYGVLLTVIVSLVISALVMGLMNAMGHVKINWFQSCQIAGMRSLGLSLGWILGILGLFLGMYQFAILIISVGGILGFIYMMIALMSYPDVKKDAVAYIGLIIAVIAAFVAYFVLKEFVLSTLADSARSASNFLNNIL